MSRNATQSLPSWYGMGNRRWRIDCICDADGNVVPDVLGVFVKSTSGIKPQSYGLTTIQECYVNDRQLLAFAVRSARRAAMDFRKRNQGSAP